MISKGGMKRGIFAILLLSLFVSTLCFAASIIDGRWTGKIEDHFDIIVNIKEENGNLSGTILSDLGEAPLTGGKIVGSDISFNEMSYKGIAVSYVKGKLLGDKINIIVGFQGQNMKGTLSRVKK